MPTNRNAIIRYKTIDNCLTNRFRQWTLDDLIEACSEALYEYEGNDRGISKRSIQHDIQIMRSDKLGYNAPIIVYDNKFYRYSDPEYSITKIPLTPSDLSTLTEVIDMLKQFKGFSHFRELTGMVQKLENKVQLEMYDRDTIIDLEKNEDLVGLDHLDTLYAAIQKKQVLNVSYQSFKARQPGDILFHAYLLKEYRNRWFVLGTKEGQEQVLVLALDRIQEINVLPELEFNKIPDFTPAEYFKNIIGVTLSKNQKPVKIQLLVNHSNAPYILTKPIHHSQKIVEKNSVGVIIQLEVIPNFELEKEVLSFGESVQVLSPDFFRERIYKRYRSACDAYENGSIR